MELLISIGRSALAIATVILVALGGIVGWTYGRGLDGFGESAYAYIFCGLGAAAGLVFSGVVFGLAAAVFEIQADLRDVAAYFSERRAAAERKRVSDRRPSEQALRILGGPD